MKSHLKFFRCFRVTFSVPLSSTNVMYLYVVWYIVVELIARSLKGFKVSWNCELVERDTLQRETFLPWLPLNEKQSCELLPYAKVFKISIFTRKCRSAKIIWLFFWKCSFIVALTVLDKQKIIIFCQFLWQVDIFL